MYLTQKTATINYFKEISLPKSDNCYKSNIIWATNDNSKVYFWNYDKIKNK